MSNCHTCASCTSANFPGTLRQDPQKRSILAQPFESNNDLTRVKTLPDLKGSAWSRLHNHNGWAYTRLYEALVSALSRERWSAFS